MKDTKRKRHMKKKGGKRKLEIKVKKSIERIK